MRAGGAGSELGHADARAQHVHAATSSSVGPLPVCTGATAQALTPRLAYVAVHRALLPDRQEAPRPCSVPAHTHARTGPMGELCPGSSPMPSPGERMPPWWGQCVVRAAMGDGEWRPCSRVLLCVHVPAAQDTRRVLGAPGGKLPQGPRPFRASTHPRFAQDPAHHQGPPGAILTCPPRHPQRGWATQPSVGLAPLFCPPPNWCPLGQCQPPFSLCISLAASCPRPPSGAPSRVPSVEPSLRPPPLKPPVMPC